MTLAYDLKDVLHLRVMKDVCTGRAKVVGSLIVMCLFFKSSQLNTPRFCYHKFNPDETSEKVSLGRRGELNR